MRGCALARSSLLGTESHSPVKINIPHAVVERGNCVQNLTLQDVLSY